MGMDRGHTIFQHSSAILPSLEFKSHEQVLSFPVTSGNAIISIPAIANIDLLLVVVIVRKSELRLNRR